ncbi:acetoacetate decarboxylase family protein [Frigidibacter sp.]|uniref:acetoacetate decarboxylase family protein n=1 Tax=Frigidibacter sp. TaxID=2586418 RepID=UPI002734EA2E|nr:acetoacetate decarboxylase family protein [Frigidibacter sp.]MDP3342170.1 acetoacetate decarboxylase family protein [Frigidibacter sp.]
MNDHSKRTYTVTKAYTIPNAAPLFQDPPYQYRNVRKISAFCKCDPAKLALFLPDEFSLAGEICEVFVMESPDAGPLGRYNEGGIVIPVSYDGQTGGHVAFEYVETDDSMAAGREIWGYPKKIADVPMTFAADGKVSGSVVRRGARIIAVDFTPAEAGFDKPVLQPRFQLKLVPPADGVSKGCRQVIRNAVTDFTLHDRVTGKVELHLESSAQDPMADLGVIEVLGGELSSYSFVLGYGEILVDL